MSWPPIQCDPITRNNRRDGPQYVVAKPRLSGYIRYPMPTPPYIELHAHSGYSFLDGASHPEELIIRARELGYPALALTDHDGVYGSMEFARAAREAGIQPITGAEIPVRDVLSRKRMTAAPTPTSPQTGGTSPSWLKHRRGTRTSHAFSPRRIGLALAAPLPFTWTCSSNEPRGSSCSPDAVEAPFSRP